jgi:hypothetical protein
MSEEYLPLLDNNLHTLPHIQEKHEVKIGNSEFAQAKLR